MTRALLGLAAVLAFAWPAAAATDSLVLQPGAASTGPGGAVEVQVLVRVYPEGKSALPVRTADVVLTAKGGGSVAPASDGAGEMKWIYRAPDAVAVDLDVLLDAHLRSYPDSSGSCRLKVTAPAKPAPPPAPTAGPVAAAGEDEEGDIVQGAEAVPAEAVGKLVTIEKWRARSSPGEEWNEKKIPARGEPLTTPGIFNEYRFRVNAPNVTNVTIQWWRDDVPKKVRTFTAANRQLEFSKDQDGLVHGTFHKCLSKEHGEYTFAIVVVTADGKTQRENLVAHRGRAAKERDDEGGGGGGGKKKQ